MPEDAIKSDVVTIAQRLKMRKANNHPTTLFLGARAGGLFRSEHFYETLGGFSSRDFNKLTHEEQFKECYNILEAVHLSETELDNLLKTSLQNLDTIEADICLAELVKDGIFHIVIS